MAGLTQDEHDFIVGFSQQTGIDPRVVAAWVYQEGAFKPGGTGGFNYLNIQPLPGDNHVGTSSSGFAQFSNVQDAIKASVAFIHQPQYRPVLAIAQTKPTPRQQIAAIAASPWDSNHYGGNGGQNLLKTFSGFFTNAGLNDSYVSPAQAGPIASTVGTGSAADWTSIDMHSVTGAAGQIAHDIASPFESIGAFFSWLSGNWDRILYVVGGGILIILAIVFIIKGQSNNTFTFARGDE